VTPTPPSLDAVSLQKLPTVVQLIILMFLTDKKITNPYCCVFYTHSDNLIERKVPT
jgi:hypothetical protein